MRAVVPAGLLARPQPHRRSILQGQGSTQEKAKARGLDALFEATREALRSVTEEDACGFFSHCGYFDPQVPTLYENCSRQAVST